MSETSTEIAPRLVVGRKRDGRCIYSRQAKRALVEACLQPGTSVARIALDHGVNANLLRRWIMLYGAKPPRKARSKADAAVLLPVSALPPGALEPAPQPAAATMSEPVIEIVVGQTTVRVRGAVDPSQLRTVLACLPRS